MSTRLLERLASIVGSAQLLTDADLRAAYETDWTRRFSGTAAAVVRPGSTDEVAAVLRTCAEQGVAVVPQGGNTGLVGGSVPRGGEVLLSTVRLRSIEALDADAGALTAGAGATLAGVQQRAAGVGWAFGVDLAARDSATIGGMIATNAGGVNVLRHGPMRSQLLGVEAVLADGSVVQRLSGLAKDNTGYDLAAVLERAPGEALLAADQSGRARLWQLRERQTEAISAAGIVHKLDVSLPLDRLAAFVARLAPTIEAVAPGARVVCYGHLADGNLHVNILGPAAGDESADGPVLRLVIELGGSISGEHGIGIAKAGWLLADRRAADVAAMRAVKRALDPMGILNPGVLFEA